VRGKGTAGPPLTVILAHCRQVRGKGTAGPPLTATLAHCRQVRGKDIACGANHTCLLEQDGEVYTWGFGGYGRLGHRVGDGAPLPPQHTLTALPPQHTLPGWVGEPPSLLSPH
jgi:alpha-tubulin suppressor-like RCC1 family protein